MASTRISFSETHKSAHELPPVLYLASHCVSWRDSFVKELMNAGIEVHSLGKCLSNGKEKEWWEEECTVFKQAAKRQRAPAAFNAYKQCIIAHYPLYLALENSRQEDYVTEKLFLTWETDTIPIYGGAPNWRKFAPDEHSLIDIDAFSSVSELADYLSLVISNKTLRETYSKWRSKVLPESWQEGVRMARPTTWCRLCQWLQSHNVSHLN